MQYLGNARQLQVGGRLVASAHGVEAVVLEAHEGEVVVLGSAGLEGTHQCVVLLPVAEVGVEDMAGGGGRRLPLVGVYEVVGKGSRDDGAVGGLGVDAVAADTRGRDVLVEDIGVGHLVLLHVQLHNAEARGEEGKMLVHADVVDGLVDGHGLHVEGTQVLNVVAVAVDDVHVLVLVDHEQLVGVLVESYQGDEGLAELVDLVVGGDALVVEVVGVEAVRRADVELATRLHNLLRFVVGHIGPPGVGLGVEYWSMEHGA